MDGMSSYLPTYLLEIQEQQVKLYPAILVRLKTKARKDDENMTEIKYSWL